jgi:DNA-binding NarL/FixJ family response regulator
MTGPDDAATGATAAEPPLSGRQLLVLQLLSRGYTPGQIASLAELALDDVLVALTEACTRLGVTDWRAAVAAARARDLLR